MVDVWIRGGDVIDGTGAPKAQRDVLLNDGKIVALGMWEHVEARTVIDASGKLVTPGFIDAHRHADAAAFSEGFGECELSQGLTSIINGNCGVSVVPLGGAYREETARYLAPITGVIEERIPTDSLSAYHAALKQHGMPIHMGMLAGGGTVRASSVGFSKTRLGLREEGLVQKGLERMLSEGALGVSLGLGYAPECFYDTEGLIRALAPIRNTNTVLSVHMRSAEVKLMESLNEMLFVAKSLRVPLQISHLKATGKRNWNRLIYKALKRLEQAREEGIDVLCDVYPYTAGSTQMLQILPPDLLVGGVDAITERLLDPKVVKSLQKRFVSDESYDNYPMLVGWENILVSSVTRAEHHSYVGKSIAELCGDREPGAFACELLAKERCAVSMIDFLTHEDDVAAIFSHPLSYGISDATYPTTGEPHPRVYGSFVRFLTRFVRERGTLSVEEAVHKLTEVPAKRYRLKDKGVLKAGADGDVLVFDFSKLESPATYEAPRQCCRGMDVVLVNGAVAWQNGSKSKENHGSILEQSRG